MYNALSHQPGLRPPAARVSRTQSMANSARIDELRKKFDENPRRYFAPLANEYRKSGDLAQAVFILEEYLPQQPGHISGHIVYGQTLFELGRDEEAKRVFETALSLDPENLIALRHLGHISRQAGDFDAARSWYQRLLEADPRDAEIEQLLGSLEAAAQAHAAELSRPSQSAPLPPPAPTMAEVDDSPLQIEHLVQQESPGAPPRVETHPLAPPPLPLSQESAPAMAMSDAAMEPPPLPEAEAPEASHDEVAVTEELLDGDDFSFGSLEGVPPAASVEASSSTNDDEAALEATSRRRRSLDGPRGRSKRLHRRYGRGRSRGRVNGIRPVLGSRPTGARVGRRERRRPGDLQLRVARRPSGRSERGRRVVLFGSGVYGARSGGAASTRRKGSRASRRNSRRKRAPWPKPRRITHTEEPVDHVGQADSFETPYEDTAAEAAEPTRSTPVASVATPVVADSGADGYAGAVDAGGRNQQRREHAGHGGAERQRERRIRDGNDGQALHEPGSSRVGAGHLSHAVGEASRRRVAAATDRGDRGPRAATSARTDAVDADRDRAADGLRSLRRRGRVRGPGAARRRPDDS